MSNEDVSKLSLEFPMPISTNKAYVTTRSGRRILSSKGKVYKQQVKDIIGQKLALSPNIVPEGPLHLKILLLFLEVENKGWSTGKAKNRYKKIDVSNRVKLLEDAICESLGIDDSMFFSLTVRKRRSPDAKEYVKVIIGGDMEDT